LGVERLVVTANSKKKLFVEVHSRSGTLFSSHDEKPRLGGRISGIQGDFADTGEVFLGRFVLAILCNTCTAKRNLTVA
jgi:hypothetical protein